MRDQRVTPLISVHLQFKCGCEDSSHRSVPAVSPGLSKEMGLSATVPQRGSAAVTSGNPDVFPP